MLEFGCDQAGEVRLIGRMGHRREGPEVTRSCTTAHEAALPLVMAGEWVYVFKALSQHRQYTRRCAVRQFHVQLNVTLGGGEKAPVEFLA